MPDDEDRPDSRSQRREDTLAADEAERAKRDSRSAAAARMHDQASWVDQQIRVAMAKGEFDDLPGAGKPIKDLGSQHDPDWWLKKLVEREQITGIAPPSVQLRKEDAELDARLDALATETEVRRELEDFNGRVIAARYRPPEGPPLITMPRDVDATLADWRARRTARAEAHREARLEAQLEARREQERAAARRRSVRGSRWWRRRS